ncbi:MAG: hypothetical protein IPK13_18140 [Deltaproteobacteria bacterium]|nr:hypothetical protein [Deltaproteobacteria bacterium]
MSTLKETLLTTEKRPRLVQDTAALVEREVSAKGGISGIAIKTGYKAVKALKPTLIEEAIDSLLDEFVVELEPFHTEWEGVGKSPSFDRYLEQRPQAVATALLRVTDRRALHVSHRTIKKTYDALRPHAEKNVIAAVPGLGRVLAKNL